MAQTIKVELTAYEALEFLKFKTRIVNAINDPFQNSFKMIKALHKMDDQIQTQLLSNATVGNFKGSHVEELINIIKNG